MLKNSFIFLLILTLFSCSDDKSSFEDMGYIHTKSTVIKYLVNENNRYDFYGKAYTLVKVVHFDSLGKVVEVGRAGSEGLWYEYRKKGEDSLQFDSNSEYWNYKISIDHIHNYIIDNGDTVKDIIIDYDKRLLYAPNPKGESRLDIYEYVLKRR